MCEVDVPILVRINDVIHKAFSVLKLLGRRWDECSRRRQSGAGLQGRVVWFDVGLRRRRWHSHVVVLARHRGCELDIRHRGCELGIGATADAKWVGIA